MELTKSELIVNHLKKIGTSIRLKELVETTKTKIPWKHNPTADMMAVMKQSNGKVVRVGSGLYRYEKPEKKVKEPKVTKTAPKVKAEPKAKAVPKAKAPKKVPEIVEEVKVVKPPSIVVLPPTEKVGRGGLKVGDKMKGTVSLIVDYGVFVNCHCPERNLRVSGLIHKSKIKRDVSFFSVADIDKHFKTGDMVDLTVDAFRYNDRVSFNTFDADLPKYHLTAMADKLTPIVEEIKVVEKSIPPEPPAVPEPAPEPVAKTVVADNHYSGSYMVAKDELEELFELVRKRVGHISLNAKDAIRDAVKRNGIVKVTMGLMSATDFEADVALAYVRFVDNKVSGGL